MRTSCSNERAPPLPLAELPMSLEDDVEPWMVEAKLPSRWPIRERRYLARAREQFKAERVRRRDV